MTDAVQHIALVFEKYCVARLGALDKAHIIIEHSKTPADASRRLFIDSGIYADDCEQLKAIFPEIVRLRSCIAGTNVGVYLFHRGVVWVC